MLSPGDRLPPHRDLALDLELSVQTVSRAYNELTGFGLIEGQVGRGTVVCRPGRATRTPFAVDRAGDSLIDLSILKPVAEEQHRHMMAEALRDLAGGLVLDDLFSFRPDASMRAHQQTMVQWLRRLSVNAQPENIVMCNGITPALTMAMLAVAPPGSTIATERLAHHTLMPLASSLGVRLVGLDLDSQGIIPDSLDKACREHRVGALFTLPTLGNPLLTVMEEERRHQIIAICRKHGVLIVENDAYGPIIESRPPPLQSLAPERTLYLTGFSKCVMPALRLGCAVVPDSLVTAVRNRHLVTNWVASPLMAVIGHRWIEDGTALDLALRQRELLGHRNRVAAELLADVPYRFHPQGMHIWIGLPDHWREEQFQTEARRHGLLVATAAPFRVEGYGPEDQAIRISLGSVGIEVLSRGLAVLRRLVNSEPEIAVMTL